MSKQTKHIQEQQFIEVLNQIQTAKQHAFQQVNNALVELYWNIGAYISNQVKTADWGKNTVEQLSDFIQQQDSELAGFNARNIWRMKQFYETYQHDTKLSTLWTVFPWSHNRRIMTLKTTEEREFYLLLCKQNKYSFRELERLIKTSTFERTMLADSKLSSAMTDLPQTTDGIFKDSYVFEF